jgi:hypothetical protein
MPSTARPLSSACTYRYQNIVSAQRNKTKDISVVHGLLHNFVNTTCSRSTILCYCNLKFRNDNDKPNAYKIRCNINKLYIYVYKDKLDTYVDTVDYHQTNVYEGSLKNNWTNHITHYLIISEAWAVSQ